EAPDTQTGVEQSSETGEANAGADGPAGAEPTGDAGIDDQPPPPGGRRPPPEVVRSAAAAAAGALLAAVVVITVVRAGWLDPVQPAVDLSALEDRVAAVETALARLSEAGTSEQGDRLEEQAAATQQAMQALEAVTGRLDRVETALAET